MIMRNSSLRDVLLGIALTLLLLVSVGNLVLIRQVASRSGLACPPVILPRSLPCESIPVDYAAREPRCTNELLRALNITNVQIQFWNATREYPDGSPALPGPCGERCANQTRDVRARDDGIT